MSQNDTQKVILITGTSSGFGLLTAARLAAAGHFVYATMRDVNKQQPLLDEVKKRRGQVFVRELDVTKPVTIAQVVAQIKDRHAHIDALVNNAGFALGGFFEDISEEEMRKQMEVNFFGVQSVCRAVIPLMRERKQGVIVNISSIAGLTASPGLGAYNASKWALEGFSETLYYELSPFNIKVALIEPGSYPTQIFTDNARYGKSAMDPNSPYYQYSRKIKGIVDNYVSKLTRDPEDIAKLIEKIITSPGSRLRYIPDWSSWSRVMASRILPPSLHNFVYRKAVYNGNTNNAV